MHGFQSIATSLSYDDAPDRLRAVDLSEAPQNEELGARTVPLDAVNQIRPQSAQNRRSGSWLWVAISSLILIGSIYAVSFVWPNIIQPQRAISHPKSQNTHTQPVASAIKADPRIMIQLNAESAKLFIDGRSVPISGQQASIRVEKGSVHEVRASAPGYLDYRREIRVQNTDLDLNIELRQRTRPRKKPKIPRKKVPISQPESRARDYVIDPF